MFFFPFNWLCWDLPLLCPWFSFISCHWDKWKRDQKSQFPTFKLSYFSSNFNKCTFRNLSYLEGMHDLCFLSNFDVVFFFDLRLTRASGSIHLDSVLSVMVFKLNLIAIKLHGGKGAICCDLIMSCSHHAAPGIALY